MNKPTQIVIRISDIEKEQWQDAAARRGQSLSEFIRFVVNMKIENDRASQTTQTDGEERRKGASMKLSDAKQLCREIRTKLRHTPVEIDDGRDDGDAEQNRAFSNSFKKINDLNKKLAGIDIDGVDCDELWRSSWPKNPNTHAPEDVYSHAMTYIDKILELAD